MPQETLSNRLPQYESKIHDALYPRWNYTGGWIWAEVIQDKNDIKVILQGYQDPNPDEWNLIIHKVKTSLNQKAEPVWQRIGTSTSSSLLDRAGSKQKEVAKNKAAHIPEDRLDRTESKQEEAAKKEAEQDIKELDIFWKEVKKSIENKAAQDIQTVFKLFEETQKGIEKTIQEGLGTDQNTDKQVRDWLDRATQGGGKIVEPLLQTINDYGQFELDWIVANIDSVDPVKAEEVIKKLQKNYPDEQARQISNRLIHEKALFTTLTGVGGDLVAGSEILSENLLVDWKEIYKQPIQIATRLIQPEAIVTAGTRMVGKVVPGGEILVDWWGTTNQLVEMIYQIADAYGFGNLKSGEIFAIYGIAISSSTLAKLGGVFLKCTTPVPGVLINAAINLIIIELVGYVAREFYELKARQQASPLTSMEAFTALEEKVDAYLEEVLTEKKILEQIAVQAVSMKEQLA